MNNEKKLSLKTAIRSNKVVKEEVVEKRGITISVDCVIFGFSNKKLKILVIQSDYEKFKGKFSLLGDLIDPHCDLKTSAQQILEKRTGLSEIFLQQVKAYGKLNRHPAGRVITIAYCALVNENHYKFKIKENNLQWIDFSEVTEMAFDHIEIANECLNWLRNKILTEPIAFNLLPKKFSLRDLQDLYTVILGEKQDRRNFRKKIQSLGYLIDLNETEKGVTHRPGKLYKFATTKQRIAQKLTL